MFVFHAGLSGAPVWKGVGGGDGLNSLCSSFLAISRKIL
jgi:hypothetical protein